MKKSALKVFAVAALLSIGGTAMAAGQAVGVQAGINLANLSQGNADTRLALQAGALYQYMFDDMFGLQAEINYKGAGAKAAGTTFGLDYVSVPIQFMAAFNAGMVKPFIVIGPQVSFKISENDTAKAAATAGAYKYSTVDFAAVAGGGVGFDITPTVAAHVLARYELGFTGIISNAPAGATVAKNRGIHILAGAAFKL